MADGPGLEAVEPFLREIMDSVAPGQRRRLTDKLMRMVRRANARRIAANVTPEAGAMPPRKKRGGRHPKKGRMFRRIGKAAALKINTTPDMGQLIFSNPGVEHTAAIHHFGLTGFVGKTKAGRIIRTKYQARELLGFGPEREELIDEMLRHVAGE